MGTLPASIAERFAHYYSVPPSLAAFKLLELNGMEYGPSVQICGTITERPDLHAPFSDNQPFIETLLMFEFFKLQDLAIVGPLRGTGLLDFQQCENAQDIRFDFRSDGLRFQGNAQEATLAISIKRAGPPPEPRVSLFSWPNVSNSCLLFGASKGFSFRMVGRPDADGYPSRCSWEATKEGVSLKGGNPIELAGLISLYEHHRPVKGKDYWWRIEGEDLVTKAHKEWEARFYGPSGKDGSDE